MKDKEQDPIDGYITNIPYTACMRPDPSQDDGEKRHMGHMHPQMVNCDISSLEVENKSSTTNQWGLVNAVALV